MTIQTETWLSEIGQEYTDRWSQPIEEFERTYIEKFGITRTQMNFPFLDGLNRNIRVLEVGCNVGNQLVILQNMGFENLYGIELQAFAVERAKERTRGINIIQGNAFDIPFKDNYFGMVFTSGALIHFAESDLPQVMKEIVRCSNEYIWGYEYYDKDFTEITWRGLSNMMFKSDYAKMYLKNFNLELVKEERWKYLNDNNQDSMFLLKKC